MNMTLQQKINKLVFQYGQKKQSGAIKYSWVQVANRINEQLNLSYSDTTYRKLYKQLKEQAIEEQTQQNNEEQISEEENLEIKRLIQDINIAKVKLQDERSALNRRMRETARFDTIVDLFKRQVKKLPSSAMKRVAYNRSDDVAVVAMLSDIHYGSTFENFAGKYNSSIAQRRVMQYAEQIINFGIEQNANDCYVSLMGDMISGNIHNSTRIENKENIVQQIVKVSQLCANFINRLSEQFDNVYVNSVSGNHSRIEMNPKQAMPDDKLDGLIPYLCKNRLANLKNVCFVKSDFGETVALFDIFGRTYVSVHGDMDKNLSDSKKKLERVIPKIDCMLAGHMHVSAAKIDDITYIRNGSVISSGDSFTTKKRLFGRACQTCFSVDDQGIRNIHPVLFT